MHPRVAVLSPPLSQLTLYGEDTRNSKVTKGLQSRDISAPIAWCAGVLNKSPCVHGAARRGNAQFARLKAGVTQQTLNNLYVIVLR